MKPNMIRLSAGMWSGCHLAESVCTPSRHDRELAYNEQMRGKTKRRRVQK